jgi:histidinol-phosphate phosphatase family protein
MDEQCRITGFYPYPHDPKLYLPNLVNAGMYYFRKDALKSWVGSSAVLDFGKDIFPALIKQGALLRGYNSPEYIKDCGTPKRLDKVSAHYESGLIASSNLRFKQKLIFLDRDGTINRSVDQLAKAEDFELLPGVAQAIAQINHAGYRAVVVTNQPVLARGECAPEELENVHRKMQTLLGEHGAYLDRIYYCPHHPDSGFVGEVVALKKVCDCRKPAIGMLTLAQKELNADLSASWLIGDSTADILAAQNAGVRSILLETGNAGLDEKYPVVPDHISPNLLTAVHYILHEHPRILKKCELWAKDIVPGDLVLIGGLSRSGKSTLAHCLQEALHLKGTQAHILSVDGWLRAPEQRGQTVIERYDMDALNQLVHSLVDRNKNPKQDLTLQMLIYSKRELKANRTIEKVIGPKDVVIIEGTTALMLAASQGQKSVHSWYVQIDEVRRKKRLIAEYVLRGKSVQDAESIYAKRLLDEVPLIESSKTHASCCIDLELRNDLP